MSRLSLRLLSAAAVLAFATPAMAETADGGIGVTSEGQSLVKVTIPPLVRIMSVQDVTFEPATANDWASGLKSLKPVCVFSNVGTNHTYKVKAGTTDSPFQVTNGSGASLPIAVTFSPHAAGNNAVPLAPGQDTVELTGGLELDSENCTPNASFEVSIEAGELQAALADTYEATLTFTVSPGAIAGDN